MMLVIACLLSSAMSLLAASQANATFRPLFKPSDLRASNELSECAPHVGDAVREAKLTWGDFQFTCLNGIVHQIFFSTSSQILSNAAQFLAHNPGLFDMEGSSIALAFQGNIGTQIFDGKPVPGGAVFRHILNGTIPTRHSQKVVSKSDVLTTMANQYVVMEIFLNEPEVPLAVFEAAIRHYFPENGADACGRPVKVVFLALLGSDPDSQLLQRFRGDKPPVRPESARKAPSDDYRVDIRRVRSNGPERYLVRGGFNSKAGAFGSEIQLVREGEGSRWLIRGEAGSGPREICAFDKLFKPEREGSTK